MRIKKVCFFVFTFSTVLSLAVSGLAQDTTSAFPEKFTDFTQAANEDPTLGDIHWIGSILQQNNSRYYEGMSVCQRLIFNGVPSTPDSTHTLTLSHEATKAGIHAYDFLTSWDNAVPAADSIAPGQNLLVNLDSDRCAPEFWGATQEICDSIHDHGYYNEADLTVLDMDTVGGHNVQLRAENYDTYFSGISRTIRIWGNDTVFSASITFDDYTGSTDNKYANYTLHWKSASDTIIIETAGHLGVGADPLDAGIGYGEGFGAADISGGPYHFKLSHLDGSSLGSQDNQIKGADIHPPAPECIVTPASAEICEGDSAEFCVVPRGGTPPYTYQWDHGPTDSCVWVSTAGTYTVVVTDAASETTSCQATLIVNSPPSCLIQPDSAEVCEDDSQEFCVIPTEGTPPYTYQWDHGPTDSCIWASTAGPYRVVVTDAKGCTTSCQAILIVNPPPSCLIEPDTAEICEGDSAEFCVIPSEGTPPYIYQWDHGPIDSCVWASTDGPYRVVVTDAKGCTTSCQAILIVNPPPSCLIQPDGAEICEGDSQEFCVVPSGGTPPYKYEWNHGPTDSCIWVSTAGAYTVVVTDAKNCTTGCQAILTVNPPPSCLIQPDSAEICEGDSAEFCVMPSEGTTPYTYQWNHGPEDSCIWIKDPGIYCIRVRDAVGCTTTCCATLIVNEPPVCTIDPLSAEICKGNSQEFCVIPGEGTRPYAYQWDHGLTDSCVLASTTGSYRVVVTDAKGCTTSCQAELVVIDVTCNVDPAADTVYAGETATFTASGSEGTPPYTCSWTGPGGFTANTCTINIINVQPADAGKYRVMVTDENGCAAACSAYLEIWEAPMCDVVPDSQSKCEGQNATFTDYTTGGTEPYTWKWTKPPDTTSLSTTNTLTINNATSANSGKYRVIVMDAHSLSDTCYGVLTVYRNPECYITGNNTIPEGSTTEFCAPPDMKIYSWTGPPGFVDPGTQCTGQIGIPGLYTVTITDFNGCESTCSRNLAYPSSMTQLGLVLFVLAVVGFFGYMILRRRRSAG